MLFEVINTNFNMNIKVESVKWYELFVDSCLNSGTIWKRGRGRRSCKLAPNSPSQAILSLITSIRKGLDHQYKFVWSHRCPEKGLTCISPTAIHKGGCNNLQQLQNQNRIFVTFKKFTFIYVKCLNAQQTNIIYIIFNHLFIYIYL